MLVLWRKTFRYRLSRSPIGMASSPRRLNLFVRIRPVNISHCNIRAGEGQFPISVYQELRFGFRLALGTGTGGRGRRMPPRSLAGYFSQAFSAPAFVLSGFEILSGKPFL